MEFFTANVGAAGWRSVADGWPGSCAGVRSSRRQGEEPIFFTFKMKVQGNRCWFIMLYNPMYNVT